PSDRLIYIPQEIPESGTAAVTRELALLGEREKGRVMTVVNLLGSDPKAILASARLSPGELRKVMLAIGIARVPWLIVLDEPTNHLDLPSIECLTEALAACACGLLLASHDEVFLGDLATRRWEITTEQGGDSQLTVRA
ncbi:MAG TPA: ABC transporter ATP-binding protein, partial [Spirochaetia bacterium]